MGKYDARKLAKDGLEQLRNQAIRLRKKGLTLTAIAEILGVCRVTVSVYWKLYQTEGSKAFKSKNIGCKGTYYGMIVSIIEAICLRERHLLFAYLQSGSV